MKLNNWGGMADDRLVAAVINNKDSDAFAELYKRYYAKVLDSCFRFQRDPDDAQDLAQDVFIKVLDRIHQFNFQAKFSTWLYSVTQRHCIDAQRMNKKNFKVPLIPHYDFMEEESDFEERLQHETRLEKIFELLAQVPLEDQQILEFKYVNKYSIDQIQTALGLTSKSAVKMRLMRARKKVAALSNAA
jgi:RNA polymerase sigma factor (sigma-70 family)